MVRKNWFVLSAIMLVCGLAISGCKANKVDGTYVSTAFGIESEVKLNNGKYEDFTDGLPSSKGTYVVEDKEIHITITDVHGDFFEMLTNGFIVIDSRWYPVDELEAALILALEDFLEYYELDISDVYEFLDAFDEFLDFISEVMVYNIVDDKTLTFTIDGVTTTYTKK